MHRAGLAASRRRPVNSALEHKMTKREAIHKELPALYKQGVELAVSFLKKEEKQLHYDYRAI
jgi:hypothetical protein